MSRVQQNDALQISIPARCHLSVTTAQMDIAKPHQLRQWLNIITGKIVRERNRGRARHRCYDLNRHINLAALQKALRERLQQV